MENEKIYIIKNIISNEEIMSKKPKQGTCVSDSFVTFQKLYCIKPKRVRGRLNSKSLFINKSLNIESLKDADIIHYWVEANGYVYDINNYQHKIIPIAEYYELCNVSDVEYALDDGLFNKNNHVLGWGPDTDEMISDNILPEFYKKLLDEYRINNNFV